LAQQNGLPFDTRTPLEVVIDLEQKGVVAFPFISPYNFTTAMPLLNNKEIFVLGGISNATTVYCNESGSYSIYESDEYGFNNPKGIWELDYLDIAVVGDSFAQGACVPPDKNAVALIRAIYPKTLNLGASGNGPLIELATIKEYLGAFKPKVVLWFYYEGNDLWDITPE